METNWKIDEAEDLPLAVIEDTEDGLGVAEIGERTPRNLANARKIKAVPQMIEALRMALRELDTLDDCIIQDPQSRDYISPDPEVIAAIREAIYAAIDR